MDGKCLRNPHGHLWYGDQKPSARAIRDWCVSCGLPRRIAMVDLPLPEKDCE